MTQPQVTDAMIEAAADAVAEAISSIGVAYSHDTDNEMRTVNRAWRVHDTGGNPFEKGEWHGEFDNKADANELARSMRRSRAIAALQATLTQGGKA